ncbi:Similar to Bradyrhizobium japonicum blr0073 protein. UniProt: [Neorhizobium galegae bv. orientalis]|nr:Similar to Bradyrhizobium japonicum blr0073 protein. UniProt: [Neorhizobium galegae bv. orientalis]
MATWVGTLTPITQSYKIWIRYFPKIFWDKVFLEHPYVTVKVIDPLIAPDPRGTGEPTPHVYRYLQPPDRPALCAWDPKYEPWDPSQYIADEIVPSTIRWLLFFEDWLDTGVWRGGGRHPDPDAMRRQSTSVVSMSPPTDVDRKASAKTALAMGMHTSSSAIGRSHYGAFPSSMSLADEVFRPAYHL